MDSKTKGVGSYRCNLCDGIVELVDDNGAEYPKTRVERFRCEECGEDQVKVLVP